MGWCSGSELAENVWQLIRAHIPVGQRHRIARQIIDLFENMDCDTIDGAEQLCHDAGRTYNPETDEISYREGT